MVAEKDRCEYRKTGSGKRCKAYARISDRFCFFHSPQTAQARKTAQRVGGIQRSRKTYFLPMDSSDKELRNAVEVCKFLGETINQARVGKLDPRVANSVGYLASVLLHALDQGSVEERLAKIEAALEAKAEERNMKEDRTGHD